MPVSRDSISRLGGASETSDEEILSGIFSRIVAKRGGLLNIHRVVGLAPKMLRAQATYAAAMREESSLPRDLQELLIIRVSQVKDSEYEQVVHTPIAISLGVSAAKIAALPDWRNSTLFDAREKSALAFVDQAAASAEVDDATFAAAQAHFPPQQLVEMSVLVGWYVGNAHFTRALRIAADKM